MHFLRPRLAASGSIVLLCFSACEGAAVRPIPPSNDGIYSFANGCYTVDAVAPGRGDARFLVASGDENEQFAFSAPDAEGASRFTLRAADLGTYLLFDQEGHYLVAEEDGVLRRDAALRSDLLEVDDTYVSGGEWEISESSYDPLRLTVRNRRTGRYLTATGLTERAADAAVITLYPASDCAEFPELTVDAEGAVEQRQFDDGTLYGIAETHSHLFTNFGFGGGGVFHGSPFHRLGVEHALPDCALFHGEEGRRDLMGYAFDTSGIDTDPDLLLEAFVSGVTPEFNHNTAGYPDFTDWPDGPNSSTHQTQYYRWLERAYLAGLRLLVQNATSNSAICEILVGNHVQPVRYSCNDMVATERQLRETLNLERYVDAQYGGPGRGWFRVVRSPAEARTVIEEGKLAVIMGIETSNLFDCFLTPPPGFPTCDEAFVLEQLDRYYEMGVRVVFPVHKYDNGFSAGDGQKGVIQLGNFVNSGYYSNFTEDCDPSIPTVFDDGDVTFGGLNMPRDVYASTPAHDFSGLQRNPIGTLAPFIDVLTAPSLPGDYCQNAGLTPLGEFLIQEMMRRGMIMDVDHLPRRSYARAFEILEANDYPAAATHGTNYNGRLYALGGVSKAGFGTCRDPDRPGATFDRFRSRVELITSVGGYPAEGVGFDLNGFARAPGPRFGDDSGCTTPQDDPVTYPFQSYAGDVTFSEPRIGNRTLDFNTEGFVHLGLLPELIEDVRGDVSDEELESVFRSAEAYLRMWERAETRSAALFPP